LLPAIYHPITIHADGDIGLRGPGFKAKRGTEKWSLDSLQNQSFDARGMR
jgi:hypothetical protein